MTRLALLRLLGLLCITLFVSTSPLIADTHDTIVPIYWVDQFGGYSHTPADASAYGVSAQGDIYVVGVAAASISGQTWLGYDDAYIRKYNSAGQEVWSRQFGSSAFDWARDVVVDTSGIYVVGDSGASTAAAFLVKYDADGNEVWRHDFGYNVSNLGFTLTVQGDAIYMGGYTRDALPGQTHAGYTDAYIRKCDTDGNEIWVRQFGTPGDDSITELATQGDYVYAIGSVGGALPGQTAQGDNDVFVRKYDTDGNVVWTDQLGTPARDSGSAIAADATGLYIAGQIAGTLPGQVQVGMNDALIRKYSTEGAVLWTHQFGTTSDDAASQVAVDSTGVYVAGWVTAALPSQTHFGSIDNYVRKYDLNGNESWTKQFGSTAEEWVGGLTVDNTAVYVSGITQGTLPTQPSTGKRNAYIMQLGADGAEGWLHQYGAEEVKPDLTFVQNAVAQDGLYVVGTTYATLPGQTNVGYSDVYVRRYNTDGAELWTHQFGTGGLDFAKDAAADNSALYILYTDQQMYYVRKYTADGVEVWTRTFENILEDIAVNSNGIYITGNTVGFLYFIMQLDVNGNQGWTLTLTNRATAVVADDSAIYVAGDSLSTNNTYLRKLDLNGNEVWTQTYTAPVYTAPVNETIRDIAVVSSGLYLASNTTATSENPFLAYLRRTDINGNELWVRNYNYSVPTTVAADDLNAYVTWNNYYNVYARKYDLEGNEVWTTQIGTSQNDSALAITLDAANIYLAGSTQGAFSGHTLAGSYDAFVAKLSKEGFDASQLLYLPVLSKDD